MAQLVGQDIVIRTPAPVLAITRVLDGYAGGYGTTPEAVTISESEWDTVNACRFMIVQTLSGLLPDVPPSINPQTGVGEYRLNGCDVWRVEHPTHDQRAAIVLLNTLSIVGQVAQGDKAGAVPQAAYDPQRLGLAPLAAVVLVLVGGAAIAGQAYAVTQFAAVADRFLQRTADLAQLRELDAHAVELTAQRLKFAADHPGVANPVEATSNEAIERLAKLQAELVRNRPHLAAPPKGLDLNQLASDASSAVANSPWTYLLLAAIAAGLYLTASNRN